MIGCCCGEGNSKIYQSFILRRSNQFYHFLRNGQGQAIRKRMVLPANLSPAARKSKNISLSNLVIFSTIQIMTSPVLCLQNYTIPRIIRELQHTYGLVNICIVEKITKFDNDIFLDFRAAGESFAGSTVRLRTACP